MSDQINSYTSPIKKELVDQIELLNLTTIQKLHLKLLAHCLESFKSIGSQLSKDLPSKNSLKDWCNKEAQKINDKQFAMLLFEQMESAARKIKAYASEIKKRPLDLTLEDLISLVSNRN